MMMSRFAFTAVLSLFAVCSFAANGTMKGDGSAEKPFQIEDYEEPHDSQFDNLATL